MEPWFPYASSTSITVITVWCGLAVPAFLTDRRRAGQLIAQAVKAWAEDGHHCQGDLPQAEEDGPYGFSAPGPEYDKRIMDVMARAGLEGCWISEGFCEKAGECGHRSFTMMAGAMDGMAVKPQRLSPMRSLWGRVWYLYL